MSSYRGKIQLAQRQLLEQRRALEQAAQVNKLLSKAISVLEEAAEESSAVCLLQQLAVRAARIRAPPTVHVPGLEPAGFAVPLEVLPDNLLGYQNDELLQRLLSMSAGDQLLVHKSFMVSASPLAMVADCHGNHAPGYEMLRRITRQYTVFRIMACMLQPETTVKYMRCNLLTGQEDSVPPGWYERVASKMPVHVGLARLLDKATTLTGPAADMQGLDALKEQISGVVASNSTMQDMADIDAVLSSYRRQVSRQLLFWFQITSLVSLSVLDLTDFPLHQVTMALLNCWPYTSSATPIFKAYLERPEVAAALRADMQLASADCDNSGSAPHSGCHVEPV